MIMLYRHCLLFIFFSLAAVLSYAEPVRVPDWAVNLGEGEYLGVSLPGGGQRQAEVMALMGMCQQRMLFCGSSAVFEDSVSYDVRKVGLLTSGETVVLISSGNSRTDYVRVTISHPFYTFPTYETSRFEADIQVEGECGMLVLASYSSKSGNNLGVMWQDVPSGGRMMWKRLSDGELGYVGYSAEDEYGPYAAVPADLSGGYDFSLEMDTDGLYLSECMLVSKAMERGLFVLSSVSFADGRLTLYSRIPPFSVWAKDAVERKVGAWQKKGKYEKSADYVKRVNNDTRQQLVDSLVAEGRTWYLRGAYYGMETEQSIVNYDADNEVFLIRDSRFGDLLLGIPIDAAPEFEDQFGLIEKIGEYDIVGDTIALVGMTYRMDDGTMYYFSDTEALRYAEVTVDYNFDPIEISAEPVGPVEDRQLITEGSLSVGKSDVDTDIPVTGRKSGNTFAVIIANENYDTESRVNYALNDGNTFRQYCIKTLGIPETNISLVQDATLNNIRAQVDMLANIGNAYGGEARLIFYYAGHGIPDESSKDAYLLPVDGYGNNTATGYRLSELYSQLSAIPASSVLVFMDACFSGADRDDRMLSDTRGIALKVKSEVPQGRMVVFSAAQGDQTALGYDEKGHGMFTYYLLKKLQESRGEVTLGELGDYVTDAVRKLSSTPAYNKPQVPEISAGESLGEVWRDIEL